MDNGGIKPAAGYASVDLHSGRIAADLNQVRADLLMMAGRVPGGTAI